MTSYVWNNPNSGNWEDTFNWTPFTGFFPTSGDLATIDGVATTQLNVPTNDTVDNLSMRDPNATLNVFGGPSRAERQCLADVGARSHLALRRRLIEYLSMRKYFVMGLLLVTAPAMAQGLQIGPGGVEVTPRGYGQGYGYDHYGYGHVDCHELRLACLHKEDLGEQGRGNCQRYRQLCHSGSSTVAHPHYYYQEQ